MRTYLRLSLIFIMTVVLVKYIPLDPVHAANTTYYVSFSSGSDSNTGTTQDKPFKTISKVNSLVLQPGDRVLFKCGDTWRGEILRIKYSGMDGSPIVFSSYPTTTCTPRPILLGTQPITGWSGYSGNTYVADLNAGANAALFPSATTDGINQLFRNGVRYGVGRWPNITDPDGGYSTIDSQPSANQFIDNQLPAISWSGATVRIKGMRWYIFNRTIDGDSGNTLTVNMPLDCWEGNCTGWGFWLDNHLGTLDRDGEWYYDPTARKVYLYSSSVNPASATIEGSVVYKGESGNMGAIILGEQIKNHVSYVQVENFQIDRWFDNGITTPTNLEKEEIFNVIIKNNLIQEVNTAGINLASYVLNAEANGNGANGWRGGRNLQLIGNTIDGANQHGINSFARQSIIEDNVIRNIALIKNLGREGMGCGTTTADGDLCTEDGDGIRLKVHLQPYTSDSMVVRYNRLENIGYTAIDVFGSRNTIHRNFIQNACISKGDCAGVRGFGGFDALSLSHDHTVSENIILDIVGNTDGAKSDYDPLFGVGVYFDVNAWNNHVIGNTIANATFTGILYINSTGNIQNNTLFNNSTEGMFGYQTSPFGQASYFPVHTGNIMLGKLENAGTLSVENPGRLGTSDGNQYYHPTRAYHIHTNHIPDDMTLSEWRSLSGKDASSIERIDPLYKDAELFYNDTKEVKQINLQKAYLDLSLNPVPMSLSLQPFTSRILVPSGAPIPNLSIVKSAPIETTSQGTVLYTITVFNNGGLAATDVQITDTLPAGSEYLSGGSLNGNQVQWSLPTLGPGQQTQVTFQVRLLPGIKTLVNSTYSVTASGGYSASGNMVITFVDPVHYYLPSVMR